MTYPTDAKLHKRIVSKVLKIVRNLNLPIRQSYTFILKRIYRDLRFRNHTKNRKKTFKADKRLRTIAGRLVRELKRNLGSNREYDNLISILEKVLSQHRNSTQKIYSIHEPDVQCISKRAGIEPTIGHLKSDYRLGRNFYKGGFGDAINVMLAAAAYNFKRAMKVLLYLNKISETFQMEMPSPKYAF